MDPLWLAMDAIGHPPLLTPPELEAIKRLVASCGKRKGGSSSQVFVKKVDIPSVELPA